MSSINLENIDTEAGFRSLTGADVGSMDQIGGRAMAIELPKAELWRPPGPIGDAFFWDDADIIGIRGPVGSGKTTAHLKSRLRRAQGISKSVIDGWRYYKVVIARETYRQLWATTVPSWWENYPKSLGKWSGGRGDPVTHHIQFEDEFGPVDFIAEFMAFGTSASEIEANIRGVQTTDMCLEEADTVPVAVVTKGSGRIDRYPAPIHFQGLPDELKSYGQISVSYNACDEDAWPVRVIEGNIEQGGANGEEARKALEQEGVNINFYRQPGYDEDGCENLQNLSSKYYPRQIAAITAEGRSNDVKRLVYNQLGFVRIGDPIFQDNYIRRKHRSPINLEPIKGHPLRIGADQGQFGAAVIGQFFEPFEWRIYAELWFDKSIFALQFGRKLRELLDDRFPGFSIEQAWCDMAGSSVESQEDVTWMSEVSDASGVEFEAQMLGGNRIAPRLAVWRAAMDWDYFGTQGLLIDPRCKMTLRGLENDYVWAQDVEKSENRKRIPLKRGNRAADVIDAGGYMMLGESQPDGLPKTAGLLGHNGGPDASDLMEQISSEEIQDNYDFDPRDGWYDS